MIGRTCLGAPLGRRVVAKPPVSRHRCEVSLQEEPFHQIGTVVACDCERTWVVVGVVVVGGVDAGGDVAYRREGRFERWRRERRMGGRWPDPPADDPVELWGDPTLSGSP